MGGASDDHCLEYRAVLRGQVPVSEAAVEALLAVGKSGVCVSLYCGNGSEVGGIRDEEVLHQRVDDTRLHHRCGKTRRLRISSYILENVCSHWPSLVFALHGTFT